MKNYKQILEAINRGIQLALDDYQDNEPNSSLSQKSDVIDTKDVIKQKYDFMKNVINLGLPSGTLWCKYNLGVNPNQLSKPEDWYGKPYAWGKIKTQKVFRESTYKIDLKLSELTPEYDAAYQNMHHYADFYFYMPTKKQFEELLEYTENKPVYNYKNIIGLHGLELTSKINDNKLFLPASGYGGGTWQEHFGGFWSKTEEPQFKNGAYSLIFNLSIEPYLFEIHSSYKYAGFTIRPVINLLK